MLDIWKYCATEEAQVHPCPISDTRNKIIVHDVIFI